MFRVHLNNLLLLSASARLWRVLARSEALESGTIEY
jgi:hypothetical protein